MAPMVSRRGAALPFGDVSRGPAAACAASSDRPRARARVASRCGNRDTMTGCSIGNAVRWFSHIEAVTCLLANERRKCAMQAARLHIEALLRARRLDRTVTDAGAPSDPVRAVTTGLPWLDPRLAGGGPRG